MDTVERVGIVGCGLMGSGIAEVCARAGLDVVVVEATGELIEAGEQRIALSLGRALASNKISASERDDIFGRLSLTTEMGKLFDRQIVIEAVSERLEDKVQVFGAIDHIVEDVTAILASNTSSLPIARLAAATSRPGSVIGLHFFNPVPVMPLVEVIASLGTDSSILDAGTHFVADVLGKKTIEARDRAGFIVNGLLIPYLLSAIRMLENGFATTQAIDMGMELGCAHPMGPLRLCDFIGIDTVKFIADALYEEYKEPSFTSPALLLRMVDAGRLGRKSGRGFYDYA